MCLEMMAMKGHFQKDMDTTPVIKKRWSKPKRRAFLSTHMMKAGVRTYSTTLGERRQRIRAWPARRSQPNSGPVDGSVPSGAMAPRNTTQYLMDIVYTELLDFSMEACDVSPNASVRSDAPLDESVFSLSDSEYDRFLDFQQRDFDNMLFRNEI